MSDRGIPNVLTKRMVLSQVAAIYDLLGLVIPFTLNAKLLMRESVTRRNSEDTVCDWDDPMPDRMREKWDEIFHDLYELEKLS